MSEPNPDDTREVAEENLLLAQALTGQAQMSGQAFLEMMARSDRAIGDEREIDGLSHNIWLGAEVAREMLEAGEFEDVKDKWVQESRRRWEDSKFFKLYQQEQQAGRDPDQAFHDRGWEM